MREIKFRILLGGNWYYWGFVDISHGLVFASLPNSNAESLTIEQLQERSQQYTGLLDKNGKEIYHFDIANNKYLLYLDLVYGIYLIDIANGDIIMYGSEEGIIDEITGNYFEYNEKISKNCQRSINQLLSQAERKV